MVSVRTAHLASLCGWGFRDGAFLLCIEYSTTRASRGALAAGSGSLAALGQVGLQSWWQVLVLSSQRWPWGAPVS